MPKRHFTKQEKTENLEKELQKCHTKRHKERIKQKLRYLKGNKYET